MPKKLVLDHIEMIKIREAGIQAFHENAEFGDVHGTELSTLLIMLGLQSYLKSKEIEVPFEVKIVKKNHRY
jgi:hypothetical protein